MADCSWRDVGLRRFFAVALGFAYLQIHSDKRSPSTFDVHTPPVSTGLLIGEGLAGVLGWLQPISVGLPTELPSDSRAPDGTHNLSTVFGRVS